MSTRARVAVLVGTRGRGSNMANLVAAGREGRMAGDVVLVVAPREDTTARRAAEELGVPTAVLPPRDPDYAARLTEALREARTFIVCLAGYMTLLPVEILHEWPDRVLNIHPALLPRHGGKGMYGHHVHEAVLAAGEPESGATVHLVTERYDEGAILVQERCPVEPGDTAETLAARVLACEHRIYPEAVNLVVDRHS